MSESILSVSELTRYIKGLLETDNLLPDTWIRGELSNFKQHSRGHMYFSVKDENSRIQAVMFAGHNRFLAFKPENGMKVLIRGEVNVYEPYGQYQLYAKEMQPDGIGSLYLAYEKLKASLEEEGLFSPSRKKAIPSFPKRIAVVTSPTGAAVRDIVTTLKRRYPIAQITLLPALVQGDHAPDSIVHAIKQADAAGVFDVLIAGRGGGSIEELWAFNDEQVVRTIAAANVPIISAVGHETDFTISDFVSDLRAPTPTAAAELAVPNRLDLLQRTVTQKQRLLIGMRERVKQEKRQLERLQKSYAFKYPAQLIRQKEQELDTRIEQLKRSTERVVEKKKTAYLQLTKTVHYYHPSERIKLMQDKLLRHKIALKKESEQILTRNQQRFSGIVQQLHLLSPLQVMSRGYSLAYQQITGELIKSVDQAEPEEMLELQVTDGTYICQITGKVKNQPRSDTDGKKRRDH
ncbi:exodeoxyribonuclease VII large subunit [Alkalicoccobacillus plakortidis]|uniref:Exodeoxyribonuclease 7 large subunit n=1 Tax=Alkalicoccobacillus plakortidis TaxID=444060 RepID=A0ABT0XGS6_9BACI|nr:exodeoxyribonuclease VII large subunit [Alkalicoccobacillus plakortidis]MCM2674970.1 exodeoxyribonuclease VII large subunit [Alkalicoccobacillus plakortidis]